MFEKAVIRNPGCQYCRYYIPQFEHNGKPTTEACAKNARKIFQLNPPTGQRRKWKWSDCDYPVEKNKNGLCKDFQIHSFIYKLLNYFSLFIRRAGKQYPPTYSGEIWWEP